MKLVRWDKSPGLVTFDILIILSVNIGVVDIDDGVQHAVIGPVIDHRYRRVVRIGVLNHRRLAVQYISGDHAAIFRGDTVRIFVKHIGSPDIVDDLGGGMRGVAEDADGQIWIC